MGKRPSAAKTGPKAKAKTEGDVPPVTALFAQGGRATLATEVPQPPEVKEGLSATDVETGSEASTPRSGRPPAMDQKSLTRMLGQLSYHGNKGNEPAQRALVTYKSLPASDKHRFLQEFMEKGSKDLSWVHSFSATTANTINETSEVKEGWFLPSQILDMNGFKVTPAELHQQSIKTLVTDLVKVVCAWVAGALLRG